MEEGGEEEEDEAPMDVIVEKGEDGEEIVKEVGRAQEPDGGSEGSP